MLVVDHDGGKEDFGLQCTSKSAWYADRNGCLKVQSVGEATIMPHRACNRNPITPECLTTANACDFKQYHLLPIESSSTTQASPWDGPTVLGDKIDIDTQ